MKKNGLLYVLSGLMLSVLFVIDGWDIFTSLAGGGAKPAFSAKLIFTLLFLLILLCAAVFMTVPPLRKNAKYPFAALAFYFFAEIFVIIFNKTAPLTLFEGVLYFYCAAMLSLYGFLKDTPRKKLFRPVAILTAAAFTLVFMLLNIKNLGYLLTSYVKPDLSRYVKYILPLTAVILCAAAFSVRGGADGDAAENNAKTVYIPIGLHVFLCLLTFGFWHFYWIYRTVKYQPAPPDGKGKKPHPQLESLKCSLIPFYPVYWYYKESRYLESLFAGRAGFGTDMKTVCLVSAIVSPVIACIIVQIKLNEYCVVTAETETAPSQAAAIHSASSQTATAADSSATSASSQAADSSPSAPPTDKKE